MKDAFAVIEAARVLPVVALRDAASAVLLARALLAGGLPCAEITLRTPEAIDAIAAAAAVPGFTVAAGTVLTVEQVDECVAAGAQVIVSPGFDPAVIDRARYHGAAVVPGVATPTEIQRALAMRCTTLKLFPVGPLGGTTLLRALAGPFPQVRFLPSGGVTAATAPEFAAEGNVLAVSGSWMVPADALAAADYDRVTALTLESLESLESLAR